MDDQSRNHWKLEDFIPLRKICPDAEFSDFFLHQLESILREGRINTSTIVNQIKHLIDQSQPSNIKLPTQFRKPPLKGFMHSHYFDGGLSMFARNLLNQINVRPEGKETCFQIAHREAAQRSDGDPLLYSQYLAHSMVHGSYKLRCSNKRMTGEWIIYKHYEGKNYFLMLANHKDGDENIFNLMNEKCYSQFPFLFDCQLHFET